MLSLHCVLFFSVKRTFFPLCPEVFKHFSLDKAFTQALLACHSLEWNRPFWMRMERSCPANAVDDSFSKGRCPVWCAQSMAIISASRMKSFVLFEIGRFFFLNVGWVQWGYFFGGWRRFAPFTPWGFCFDLVSFCSAAYLHSLPSRRKTSDFATLWPPTSSRRVRSISCQGPWKSLFGTPICFEWVGL